MALTLVKSKVRQSFAPFPVKPNTSFSYTVDTGVHKDASEQGQAGGASSRSRSRRRGERIERAPAWAGGGHRTEEDEEEGAGNALHVHC